MEQHPNTSALLEEAKASTEASFETKLTHEIAHLRGVHSQAQTVLGRTKQELGALRLELGRRLYEMKMILAYPGRTGQWSKFLSAQRIPRASADRYAKNYQITLNPPEEIASSEAIQDSTDETVRKLLQSVWPKLRDRLKSPETTYEFLCTLVQRCDTLQAEITDSGIAIRKPTMISSDLSSGELETQKVDEGQSVGCECE